MVFDFAAQPPELISAKIYSGPGAESLQSAAAAWDALASELQSTAAQFESTIAGLVSGDWTGPSSEAAAAAAAPYVSWLSTTAGQAEQTAGQARAAAGAYETALAATVPPAEIAANRTQLLSLLPANIFGQIQRGNRGPGGRVRPVLGPGRRRPDRLCRVVAGGHHRVGLVHRGAADHERQRPGGPGRRDNRCRCRSRTQRSGIGPRAGRGHRHQLPQPGHHAERRLHQVRHQRARHHPGRVHTGHHVDQPRTRSSPAPVARPPGRTWPTARPVWASRSGRTSSSTSPGATASGSAP